MSGTSRMISGAIDYIKGKLQRASGSKTTQMKGMGNQAKGGVKYESGKVENKIDGGLNH